MENKFWRLIRNWVMGEHKKQVPWKPLLIKREPISLGQVEDFAVKYLKDRLGDNLASCKVTEARDATRVVLITIVFDVAPALKEMKKNDLKNYLEETIAAEAGAELIMERFKRQGHMFVASELKTYGQAELARRRRKPFDLWELTVRVFQ